MSRTLVNFVLDALLLVNLLAVILTAAILHLVFPPGPQAGGWRLFGLYYQHWGQVHFFLLFCFTVLAAIHVMLHWSWVCGVIANRVSKHLGRKWVIHESTQTVIGVAFFVFILHLLGAGYLVALLFVRSPESVDPSWRASPSTETFTSPAPRDPRWTPPSSDHHAE